MDRRHRLAGDTGEYMFYGDQGATGVRGDTGTQGDTGIGIRGDTGTIGHYDTGAAVIGDTRYAALEFEQQIRQALRDDKITDYESKALVNQHNRLQRRSRKALQEILRDKGYRSEILNNELLLEERARERRDRIYIPPLPDPPLTKLIKPPRRKIPQKAVWFAIVVPSVLASLLGVLGVI